MAVSNFMIWSRFVLSWERVVSAISFLDSVTVWVLTPSKSAKSMSSTFVISLVTLPFSALRFDCKRSMLVQSFITAPMWGRCSGLLHEVRHEATTCVHTNNWPNDLESRMHKILQQYTKNSNKYNSLSILDTRYADNGWKGWCNRVLIYLTDWTVIAIMYDVIYVYIVHTWGL